VESPRRRVAVSLALACLALSTVMAPIPALAVGTALLCTGTVQVGYAPPITPVPATGPTVVTLSTPTPLACTGPMGGATATVAVSGTQAAGAACAGLIALTGIGSIALNGGAQTSVAWTAAGTAVAQWWTFVQAIPSPTLEAVGGGAWAMAVSGAPGCVAGTAAVPFQAALSIVA
jgi:hypothetical protein